MDEAGSFSSSSLSLSYLSQEFGSSIPINPVYYPINHTTSSTTIGASSVSSSIVTDAWLVNGQYQPTLYLQPGEWRIMDILAASGDRILEIEIKPYIGNPNIWNNDYSCDVKLLALDGMYLDSTRSGPFVRHLTLLQGARASLAVQCNLTGLYYLQTVTSFNESSPYYGIGEYQTNLVNLRVAGTFIDYQYPPPADLTSIQRPTIYNNIESNPNAYNNASLSFSTAQLGSENSFNCAEKTLFWMGV
eukprot:gene29923-39723_t